MVISQYSPSSILSSLMDASHPNIKMKGKRRRGQAKHFDQNGYEGHRPRMGEAENGVACAGARDTSLHRKKFVFRALSYNSGGGGFLLLFIEDFRTASME